MNTSIVLPLSVVHAIQGYVPEESNQIMDIVQASLFPSPEQLILDYNQKNAAAKDDAGATDVADQQAQGTLLEAHRNKIRQGIMTHSKGCKGHIVLLAPGETERGLCQQIAKQFAKITLVGLSKEWVEPFAKDLIAAGAKEVECVAVDLAGRSAQFETAVCYAANHIHKQRLNVIFDDYLMPYFDAVIQFDRRCFASIARADFVVSSLVASQLHHNAESYFSRLLKRYPKLERLERVTEFSNHLFKTMETVFQAKHISDLHKLVIPGGKVYLADTTKVTTMQLFPFQFVEKELWKETAWHVLQHKFDVLEYSQWYMMNATVEEFVLKPMREPVELPVNAVEIIEEYVPQEGYKARQVLSSFVR